MKLISIITVIALIVVSLNACKDKSVKSPPPPPLVRKEKGDTSHKRQKGPIINVVDTVEQKFTVLSVKDSSSTSAGMSEKLNNIYNKKIPDAIKAAKIKAMGQPMAWYRSQKSAFFFEAGIPVDKAPAKLAKGMFIKKTGGDSVLTAHFFGPNELSTVGYDALSEMLKDRNKRKTSPAYEIYIDNPFASLQIKIKKDAYKMQTDIVMPYK